MYFFFIYMMYGVLAVALTRRSWMVPLSWHLRTSHCLRLSCQVVSAGIGCRSEMVWGCQLTPWARAGFKAESPSSSVRLVTLAKASSTLVALRSLLWLQLDESFSSSSSWENNRIPCPALPTFRKQLFVKYRHITTSPCHRNMTPGKYCLHQHTPQATAFMFIFLPILPALYVALWSKRSRCKTLRPTEQAKQSNRKIPTCLAPEQREENRCV